jgi:hypothetical protein
MKAYWGNGGTYWIGGWVGHRAVLDAVVKRKIPGIWINMQSNVRRSLRFAAFI